MQVVSPGASNNSKVGNRTLLWVAVPRALCNACASVDCIEGQMIVVQFFFHCVHKIELAAIALAQYLGPLVRGLYVVSAIVGEGLRWYTTDRGAVSDVPVLRDAYVRRPVASHTCQSSSTVLYLCKFSMIWSCTT
jgi:hypothetical protein